MGLRRGVFGIRGTGQIGADVELGRGSRIDAADIAIGAGTRIGAGVVIEAERLVVEPGCHIGDGCVILAPEVSIGYNCVLFPGVTVRALTRVSLGAYTKISRAAVLKAGRVTTGVEFWMNRGAEIGGGGWRSPSGGFVAGDRCHVGRNTHVNTAETVTLGHDTAVGMDCTIATHAHWQPESEGFPHARGPVLLGTDVAVYSRSIISPGVTIHSGGTIAGGSVVLADVPERGLVAGVPARLIRTQQPPADPFPIFEKILAAFAERAPHYDQDDLTLTDDCRLLVRAAGTGGGCEFDLRERTVHGHSGPLSEAVRGHLFAHGLRFRYTGGYQRTPMSPQGLVDAGLED